MYSRDSVIEGPCRRDRSRPRGGLQLWWTRRRGEEHGQRGAQAEGEDRAAGTSPCRFKSALVEWVQIRMPAELGRPWVHRRPQNVMKESIQPRHSTAYSHSFSNIYKYLPETLIQ